MSTRSQAGFTLVELTLVMAITALLAGVAFVGQLQLRTRAQFDADVDKLVASISQARDEAAAGINFSGLGNGQGIGDGCTGSGTTPTVFAGDVFTADNALVGGPFQISFYKANPNVAACTFSQTQIISVPSGLRVTAPAGRDVFVRTPQGGLDACPVTNLSTNIIPYFKKGACPVGSWTLAVHDTYGHTSQIYIDQSGLAQRLN